VCEPGTVVLASGQVNDVRLYRELVASGIHDYLLKPLTADMLRDSFVQAQAVLNTPKAVDPGSERAHCAAAVIGTRGGCGASTIATSLAWAVSEKHSRTTALLDLDVHFGTGALALDLEPGRGLTDAIENPSRIDGLFIERAMVRASERLAVLSAEAPINSPIMTDGTAFYQLQEEIRGAFETTVIDLPRAMLVNHPHLITDVQVAVIVTELTLAAARDAIRILSWFKSNAPQTKLILVANKVHGGAMLEISRKDFEGSIERRLDYVLSYDPKSASQAAKLGKTLVDAGKGNKGLSALSELAQQLCAIADSGEVESAPAKGKADAPAGKEGSLLGKLKLKLPKKTK
jgi:pilus assembly protein CpaE